MQVPFSSACCEKGALKWERKSGNRERHGFGHDGEAHHGPVGGRQSRAHGRALAHVIVPIRRVLRKELSQKISFSELGFSSDDILYIFASEIFILRTISEEIFK